MKPDYKILGIKPGYYLLVFPDYWEDLWALYQDEYGNWFAGCMTCEHVYQEFEDRTKNGLIKQLQQHYLQKINHEDITDPDADPGSID